MFKFIAVLKDLYGTGMTVELFGDKNIIIHWRDAIEVSAINDGVVKSITVDLKDRLMDWDDAKDRIELMVDAALLIRKIMEEES